LEVFKFNECKLQSQESVFLFLLLTTEAMGICPSADGGSIRCPSTDGQIECGSKTAGMHVSQLMRIERVLAVHCFYVLFSLSIFFLNLKFSMLSFQINSESLPFFVAPSSFVLLVLETNQQPFLALVIPT